MTNIVTNQLGSLWTDLFGPPAPTMEERRVLLNQFPALQRRNRTLYDRWAALMNRLEAGERFGNADTPRLLGLAGDAIAEAERGEAAVFAELQQAAQRAVAAGALTRSQVQQSGLGAFPILAVAVIGAILGFTAIGIFATWRMTPEYQARAQILLDAAERGELPPPNAPGPIERTIGGGVALLALAVGAALFLRGRK